jgi:hypothetical protein
MPTTTFTLLVGRRKIMTTFYNFEGLISFAQEMGLTVQFVSSLAANDDDISDVEFMATYNHKKKLVRVGEWLPQPKGYWCLLHELIHAAQYAINGDKALPVFPDMEYQLVPELDHFVRTHYRQSKQLIELEAYYWASGEQSPYIDWRISGPSLSNLLFKWGRVARKEDVVHSYLAERPWHTSRKESDFESPEQYQNYKWDFNIPVSKLYSKRALCPTQEQLDAAYDRLAAAPSHSAPRIWGERIDTVTDKTRRLLLPLRLGYKTMCPFFGSDSMEWGLIETPDLDIITLADEEEEEGNTVAFLALWNDVHGRVGRLFCPLGKEGEYGNALSQARGLEGGFLLVPSYDPENMKLWRLKGPAGPEVFNPLTGGKVPTMHIS